MPIQLRPHFAALFLLHRVAQARNLTTEAMREITLVLIVVRFPPLRELALHGVIKGKLIAFSRRTINAFSQCSQNSFNCAHNLFAFSCIKRIGMGFGKLA